MAEIAIRVENLSKLYYLNYGLARNMLREVIVDVLKKPLKKVFQADKNDFRNKKELWALKDISFKINKGEVVGVIGRNGAGKSTLLKILARITPPTKGYARLYGRLSSILEIGTGFHGELTGRENVFFNGALLGMKRRELIKKLDEIVAFAELEKFIDTPLKHYSSGMAVRLAFSVAAHLEPEILLVDEVLSVGDSVFQQKCLGKMGDFAKGGRTVLFVTHQLNQVRRLCEKCIWLANGMIQRVGSVSEVVSAYEASFSSFFTEEDPTGRALAGASSAAVFFKWEAIGSGVENYNTLTEISPLTLRFWLKVGQPLKHCSTSVLLFTSDNQLVWGNAISKVSLEPGVYTLEYSLSSLPLRPSTYYLQVVLFDENGSVVDNWQCYPHLVVATKPMGHFRDEYAGILNIPCSFLIKTK